MDICTSSPVQEYVKENDGWVTMETMLKFKRLADLSKDTAIILGAMKKSKSGQSLFMNGTVSYILSSN
jgi:hypothetical protein